MTESFKDYTHNTIKKQFTSLDEFVNAYDKTKPMKLEDFATCTERWGEGKTPNAIGKRKNCQENEQAWKVGIKDIIARNYNLDVKNSHVGEVIRHAPEALLALYAKQLIEIQKLRAQVKNILSASLSH